MGRKMKNIVALLVILGLIYWQQPSAVRPAYARDEGYGEQNVSSGQKAAAGSDGSWEEGNERSEKPESPSDGSGKKESGKDGTEEGAGTSGGGEDGTEEGSGASGDGKDETEEGPGTSGDGKDDTEENPGTSGEDKDDTEGNPGTSGEDKDDTEENPDDKEEKPIECFKAFIPPEDGQNGYYKTRPEAEVCHNGERGVTRYCFTDSSGRREEGGLTEKDGSFKIGRERFLEGSNHLSVWMEDEDGKRVEEYALEKTFLVDTQPPSVRIQTPMGAEAWYQKEVFINASGEDGIKGSQIEEIACFVGSQKIGSSREASAGFLISYASAGGKAVPVTVRVTDRAGNIARETCGLYIDQRPPRTAVERVSDYMITSEPVEVAYRIEEENAVGKMEAGARWEDPRGQIRYLAAEEWKEEEGGRSARQTLAEDGIYQLSVSAWDQAGYEGSSKGQVIIDSEDPVIRHVDELDGQYMKSFCWEYPVEETVEDFTSYTYSVYLDGRPYHIGENVLREGRHVLEVQAEDAAGNKGRAEAGFAIDRAAPRIIFGNARDGQVYEEAMNFEVSLEDQEDYIEEIRINGALQEISAKKKTYSYTVKECRDYEVLVKAYDRAGNYAVSCMDFTVAHKQSLLNKFAGPIRKMLGVPVQESTKEPAIREQEEAGAEPIRRGGIVLLSLAGIGCMTAIVWRRKTILLLAGRLMNICKKQL
jgi:hypothetical protein